MNHRHLRLAALCCLFVLFAGCARGWIAERDTASLLDPATAPQEQLRLQGRLIALRPESDKFLNAAFFPIGLYDVPEGALTEVAAAGFNLVVNGSNDASYLARAQAAGLRVIPYLDTLHIPAQVKKAAGQTSLYAWYLFDEPDLNGFSPRDYQEISKVLHNADSSRPVFLTVLSPENYRAYAAGCDILAPNAYPIRNKQPELNDLRRVAACVEAARAAVGPRPVWAVLEAFFAEPTWPRNPTPDELRAMAFMALNHGATGIIYFSYQSGDRPITQHVELFAAIERLNGQFRALRGALLSPPSTANFKYQIAEEHVPESAPSPGTPLDCSLRPFLNAQLFIAVNPHAWKKSVRISAPESAVGKSMEELFLDSPAQPLIVPSTEPLTLSFEPFQTRVFWIR